MTDDEARENNDLKQIENEALLLENLKQQKKEIEQEIADIEQYLDKAIETTVRFENGDESVTVTPVRGTVDRFDDFLMARQFPDIWEAVTKRTLDKAAYLNALKAGVITPELHAMFHHESPKKSWVKITRYFKGNAIEASE